jgi:FlgD Ig-like domain
LAFSNISLVFTPDITAIDVDKTNSIISEFILYQNYPNPFNPSTIIEFDVSQKGGITTIFIYNSIGQIIRNLFTENISGGKYRVTWNGKNDRNVNQPSGVYYFQLIFGIEKQTKKMVLMR